MNEINKAIEDFCCGFPHLNALSDKGEVHHAYDERRFGQVIIELIKNNSQAYSFKQAFIDSFKRNEKLKLSDDECKKYADAYVHMVDICREIIDALLNEGCMDIK